MILYILELFIGFYFVAVGCRWPASGPHAEEFVDPLARYRIIFMIAGIFTVLHAVVSLVIAGIAP